MEGEGQEEKQTHEAIFNEGDDDDDDVDGKADGNADDNDRPDDGRDERSLSHGEGKKRIEISPVTRLSMRVPPESFDVECGQGHGDHPGGHVAEVQVEAILRRRLRSSHGNAKREGHVCTAAAGYSRPEGRRPWAEDRCIRGTRLTF